MLFSIINVYPITLHHSALQTELPFKSFLLMEAKDDSPQFRFLAKKLKQIDVDFFMDKAIHEKKSFLFEVVLDYNFEDSLGNSIDIGLFPSFRTVGNQDLSEDQQEHLRSVGRNCQKEPPKLVSAHKRNHLTIDFVDNLLFLLTHMSCVIVEVLSITSFYTAPFLSDYMISLQNARSKATSPQQAKVIKNLANRYRLILALFLDASSHLYKRVSPSVHPSVGQERSLSDACETRLMPSIRSFLRMFHCF